MTETKKVAISLPQELMRKIERIRKATGESRSAFISRAIRQALKDREQEFLVARYVEGYRKFPETKEEIELAEASAARLLAEEPWE